MGGRGGGIEGGEKESRVSGLLNRRRVRGKADFDFC